jgi:hypothetical protein
MGGWVFETLGLIMPSADYLILVDRDRADGHFISLKGFLRFPERLFHEIIVVHVSLRSVDYSDEKIDYGDGNNRTMYPVITMTPASQI